MGTGYEAWMDCSSDDSSGAMGSGGVRGGVGDREEEERDDEAWAFESPLTAGVCSASSSRGEYGRSTLPEGAEATACIVGMQGVSQSSALSRLKQ